MARPTWRIPVAGISNHGAQPKKTRDHRASDHGLIGHVTSRGIQNQLLPLLGGTAGLHLGLPWIIPWVIGLSIY
jgi:hypothetical protein